MCDFLSGLRFLRLKMIHQLSQRYLSAKFVGSDLFQFRDLLQADYGILAILLTAYLSQIHWWLIEDNLFLLGFLNCKLQINQRLRPEQLNLHQWPSILFRRLQILELKRLHTLFQLFREWQFLLMIYSRLLHKFEVLYIARKTLHCSSDWVISSTSAHITIQSLNDSSLSRVSILPQQCVHGHRKTTSAVTTLERFTAQKLLLNWM